MIPIDQIRAAAQRISSHLHKTALFSNRSLSEEVGASISLKCESLQKTGSFKPRGALNIVLSLPEPERSRGLVTVSAGNHAQAVAWAAKTVGVAATVVMPTDAPHSKIEAVRGYGADIVFHEDRDTLFDKLREVQSESGATFVHPFDDPVGLAGAGTVGLEILEQLPDASVVVVPAGGGGLLAGVTSAIKAMSPTCRIVAVELEEGPGFAPSLTAGKVIPVSRPYETLADGLTPPFVGSIALEIAREAVDEIVAVSEEEIVRGVGWLITRAKLFPEGAGAVATAALLAGKIRCKETESVVSIVSGGNVDPERLFLLFQSSREVRS